MLERRHTVYIELPFKCSTKCFEAKHSTVKVIYTSCTELCGMMLPFACSLCVEVEFMTFHLHKNVLILLGSGKRAVLILNLVLGDTLARLLQ